jgi:hypothetical protein
MSFYQTTNNMQSGQSFTLEVSKSETSGKTRVSCPSMPDVEAVEDTDSRFAVQEMKRRLDDHLQGAKTRPLLLEGSNED